jgi:YD repeat-containing protein
MKNLTKNRIALFTVSLFIVMACKTAETVTPLSPEKTMSAFSFSSLSPAVTGAISGTNITATVPFGTNLNLAPTITVSAKATVSPSSGSSQDFSKSVAYTVTAEDGSKQTYNVAVSLGKSPEKDILTFAFNGITPALVCTIDAATKTISATLPAGTDATKLVPTLTLSPKASVSPATGVAQDFTNPVNYTVTAEDATTVTYKVTITKPNTCSITGIKGTDFNSTYEFDAKKRLTKVTTVNGTLKSTTTYEYDADDYLKTRIYNEPGSSSVITFTYKNGKLVLEDYTDKNGTSSTKYEYDSNGNIIKRDDGFLIYTYSNGKTISIVTVSPGSTYEVTSQGFISKIVYSLKDGFYSQSKYDNDGQLLLTEFFYNNKKTAYNIFEYTTIKNTDQNFYNSQNKGRPVIPNSYGANVYLTKRFAHYEIAATGVETKTSETITTYDIDSKGKISSYTQTDGSGIAQTYTYSYQDCN